MARLMPLFWNANSALPLQTLPPDFVCAVITALAAFWYSALKFAASQTSQLREKLSKNWYFTDRSRHFLSAGLARFAL